ncbi:MAG: DUF1028 domain-containing protein [Terrimesophilobacter sp.]
MTYSIIARDVVTGQFGIAVQSHFLAAGQKVPGALAGVGAVATQANVRTGYRKEGLQLLSNGASAEEALAASLANDPMPELRQVAMIDAQGHTAAHTGTGCWKAASHHADFGVSAQANTVADRAIPGAMVAAYQASAGPLSTRLLAALDSAEALGGDLRGRQSAAIYIVGGTHTVDVDVDVLMDLRVDNDPEPLAQLRTAVGLAIAFEPMWWAIRGPACRGPIAPSREETEEAFEVLTTAQGEYGPQNLEPTFWRAIALWRASRQQEARQALTEIAKDNPGWTLLFDDVVSRWPIPRTSTERNHA